jgi:hypothetical protein
LGFILSNSIQSKQIAINQKQVENLRLYLQQSFELFLLTQLLSNAPKAPFSHDAAALHRRHERKIPYVVRRHLTVRSTESFLRTTYGIWRNAAVPAAIP